MIAVTGRDFFDLVKAIGESKSKQEEDRIITEEVKFLKKAVPNISNTKKKLKELVVRAVYVEMLGQDASFAYIKAVELCASTNILHKRVGYLAASLCLSPEHEFRFMLVNQIQRDINSTNHLEACAALSAVCKVVNADMIPAIIKDVVKALKHDIDVVRRKAVCALHRLYQMDKSCLKDHVEKVRRIICDIDPSVMGACLGLLSALIIDDTSAFKDLVPSLVSILKQITDHRLPRDFDYHRTPAPWIQMHILRILAVLGRGDQTASEGMYEVLGEVMRKADTGINVGYAIVFETVQTITAIYPNFTLLDSAATSISRFIRSDSHNLKYMGIKGLAAIVKDFPQYASDHQMAVIDCLEDPDETLKRKTLDLLFRMTNAVNVEFIVEKLLSYLSEGSSDDHFRSDLVAQITQCAERFAPSTSWYVRTVVRVFELAGDKVKPAVAQTLMQLIAEGTDNEDGDDVGNDSEEKMLRTQTVDDFLVLLEKPKLPQVLAQSIAWVLGEYGYLSSTCSKEGIMLKLSSLLQRSADPSTRAHCITALMKLVAQNGSCPQAVFQLVCLYEHSASLDLHQRCSEFLGLLAVRKGSIMADALPVDASCEDLDIDKNLFFLEDFVTAALAAGAKPYCPPENIRSDSLDYQDEKVQKSIAGFITAPYERPPSNPGLMGVGVSSGTSRDALPHSASASPVMGLGMDPGPSGGSGTASKTPGQGGHHTNGAERSGNQLLNTKGVAQVWGRKPEVPVPVPGNNNKVSPPNVPAPVTATHTAVYPAYPVYDQKEAKKDKESIEEVREPSEREKMALALFGGMKPTPSSSSSSSSSSSAHKGGAVTAVSVSPTILIQPIPYKKPQSGSAGPDLAPLQTRTPDFMNLNTSPKHDLPFTSSSSSSSSSSSMKPMDSNITNHINGNGTGSGSGMGIVTSTSRTQSPNTPPLNPTMSSTAPVPLLMPMPVPSSPSLASSSSPSPSLPVLTPLKITTQYFGQLWSQVGLSDTESSDQPTLLEGKSSCQCGVTTLERLRAVLPSHYGHVESIPATQEAIFASLVMSSSSDVIQLLSPSLSPSPALPTPFVGNGLKTGEVNMVILIHIQLQVGNDTGTGTGKVEITVKSSSRDICASTIQSIISALATSS